MHGLKFMNEKTSRRIFSMYAIEVKAAFFQMKCKKGAIFLNEEQEVHYLLYTILN